jgi:hypothetical protein
MPTYYEHLIATLGEDGAKQKMSEIAKQRKVNNGGGFNDSTVREKAIKKRWGKKNEGDRETSRTVSE